MLTLEEVEHIATLARLELTAEEKERFRAQLSDILDYAARLQALDTSGIALADPGPLPGQAQSARLRPDEPQPPLPRQTLLRSAPQAQDGQFRVPPILDNPA